MWLLLMLFTINVNTEFIKKCYSVLHFTLYAPILKNMINPMLVIGKKYYTLISKHLNSTK